MKQTSKNSGPLRHRTLRWWQDTDGSATIEFVLWFPVFFVMFLMSFELAFYELRAVLLERAVDLSVRDIRIGLDDLPTSLTELKQSICSDSLMFSGCSNDDLTISIRPISENNWNFANLPVECVDRAARIDPDIPHDGVESFDVGNGGELMLVTACLWQKPFFPGTFTLMKIRINGTVPVNDRGDVAISVFTTFVNEPGFQVGSS